MYKEIKILQVVIDPIILKDDDETPIEEYVKNLEKIFISANVTTIHTSSGSALVRPSKLVSILVTEVDEEPKKKKDKITDG